MSAEPTLLPIQLKKRLDRLSKGGFPDIVTEIEEHIETQELRILDLKTKYANSQKIYKQYKEGSIKETDKLRKEVSILATRLNAYPEKEDAAEAVAKAIFDAKTKEMGEKYDDT